MRQSRIDVRHMGLLAAVLALGACGGNNPPADETAADVAAEAAEDAPEASATYEGADAADASAVLTKVPDWFPGDVYLPDTYSVVVARDLGAVQQLELRVDGETADLAAKARAAMEANGWDQSMDTGTTVGYTKEKRIANVTVDARDDGGTRVSYQFSTI